MRQSLPFQPASKRSSSFSVTVLRPERLRPRAAGSAAKLDEVYRDNFVDTQPRNLDDQPVALAPDLSVLFRLEQPDALGSRSRGKLKADDERTKRHGLVHEPLHGRRIVQVHQVRGERLLLPPVAD